MVVGDFPIEIDTLVVGAGPGGYVAAIRAAQLGQKVTIVEKDKVGGVCLNVGCIPSKALISASHRYEYAKKSEDMGIKAENVSVDFTKVQEWKVSVIHKLTSGVSSLLKANHVDLVKGEVYFVDQNTARVMDENHSQTYTFKHAIIATGSRPIELPNIKFSKRVMDSTGALNLQEIPKKMVVIGGGYIGTELGSAYASFGTEVIILEGSENILAGFENQMTQIVKKRLSKKGVVIHTKAMVSEVIEQIDGVQVKVNINGNIETIDADYCLVTVGRKPNTDEMGLEKIGILLTDRGLIKIDKQCRTNISNIFAIGDIVEGPPLAHKASYEGKIAAEVISGMNSVIDYYGIPAVCYTDPELATVGYTEGLAREQGIEINVSKFPFQANGRALSLDDTEGFMKLITRKKDNVIIGAQIVGPNASELISELSLAVENCLRAEDVALTIHAHPTLGEITMEAAEVALGHPIHVIK
ncbi:dihydrolipoyl dehydrogenase [Calidifontibacillus erzurumensis]|uniref:Dihydrolipoyl dehydrogenase n=1 Tax=Calidifontibacillus erzurumensis TaxID=2741433 RepID=A0A8J8GHR1_9BACI|nr:dihydrolipoyl dehydrogenase [Calidifontibacillus erzurumensis]NSL52550.1 dihydrolipoyl dehydrogenase [Calidifontibacillus erzurumensis]